MGNSPVVLAAVLALAASAFAQLDKPRVFVDGKGTTNASTNAGANGNRWFARGRSDSTVGAHDESMEVTKDLQQSCPGVIVTLNQATADYTVQLDRESKQNRGLLRTNSQVQVSNRVGDVLGSKATRTVNTASKDACSLILSDWAQHGRIDAPAPMVAPTTALVTLAPVPVAPAPAPASYNIRVETPSPAGETVVIQPEESLGAAAKRARQHTACLKLAEENPSIVCK